MSRKETKAGSPAVTGAICLDRVVWGVLGSLTGILPVRAGGQRTTGQRTGISRTGATKKKAKNCNAIAVTEQTSRGEPKPRAQN